MVVSVRFNSKFQKKSISLPCRSHPSTLRIEEELTKIKSSTLTKASADNISDGLCQLANLYDHVDDLLASVATQNLISAHGKEMWLEEVLEGSIKLLDVCSILRDVILQIKENLRDLQCALRRRKGQTSIGTSIKEFSSFRKNMLKDAKELIMSLKQSEKSTGLMTDPCNHHLTAVIRVFVEITDLAVVVFESLFKLVSPVSKVNGWSIAVSKLIHKRAVACQQTMNEFENIDAALHYILCNGQETSEDTRTAHSRVEDLYAKITRIESGLGCLFRRFLKTRIDILNIISL
uniref:uncharacterized protein LOC122610237 n=1 Tax=Erigeron canadensis TaxID=72917 RepID=UPI001CB99106|nr:uncharacterized protein LOC122610237 [Erigeron canadensis]